MLIVFLPIFVANTKIVPQLAITYSKLTIETLEQDRENVQS